MDSKQFNSGGVVKLFPKKKKSGVTPFGVEFLLCKTFADIFHAQTATLHNIKILIGQKIYY